MMRIELKVSSAKAATVLKAVAEMTKRAVMFLMKTMRPQQRMGTRSSIGKAKLQPFAKARKRPENDMAAD